MKKLICVFALVCLCLSSCGGDSGVKLSSLPDFATPLQTALTALINGDGEGYYKAFPPKMEEDYKTQEVCAYYFSFTDMSSWLENAMRVYDVSYGKGLYIKGEIVSSEKVALSTLGDANLDYYTYMRYATEENTEEVQRAVFSYTIGGDESMEEKEATLYFVKQDGKWYLHSYYAFYNF